MPIYEYICQDCQREFEKLVRSSDAAPVCPHCASSTLARKLSAFAAVTGGSQGAPTPGPCGACGHPAGPGACGIHPG